MRLRLGWSVLGVLAMSACGGGGDAGPAPDAGPPDAFHIIDAYIPPENCQNGFDDDHDGWIDCDDSDCATEPACIPEASCNNHVDDDGDGHTDCADSDCAASPVCLPETDCTNGSDDDQDGQTDCADSDCTLSCAAACPPGTTSVTLTPTTLPVTIADLATEDVPMTSSAAGTVAGGAFSFSLTHTYDGDLELSLLGPGGATIMLSNRNGGGSDNYTGTILSDNATTPITAGTPPFTGAFQPQEPFANLDGATVAGTWTFRIADLAGGDFGSLSAASLTLCACSGDTCEVGPSCGNGLDDDGDGDADCADSGCTTNAHCLPEPNCTNGLDDDTDGLIDCADADCATATNCLPETACSNGLDDDSDGTIDCADTDCTTSAYCSAETDCANGTDDDADGFADCLDPGCNGISGCELGTEVSCSDGLDNDGDGAIDCADTTCAGTVTCATTCPVGSTQRTYTATDVPMPIPDVTTIQSHITAADAGSLTKVAVRVDLTHTFDGDLEIQLIAPGGTVMLSNRHGGGGDDYSGTIFVDGATPIASGVSPFTGTFAPDAPLAALNATANAGTWTLQIADLAGADVGTLTNFQVVTCSN